MSRQVNYHLARARAAASGAAGAVPFPIATCADALVRTLLKLYAGRPLEISTTISPELHARVQRKIWMKCWAIYWIMPANRQPRESNWERLEARNMLVLTVDDDGPGLAPDLRTSSWKGASESTSRPRLRPWSSDCARSGGAVHGSISLDQSPLGGLRAQNLAPGGLNRPVFRTMAAWIRPKRFSYSSPPPQHFAARSRSRPKFGRFLSATASTCHQPGEIAPMPLTSFAEVRPWANASERRF